MLTYAELELLAEAAQRFGLTGNGSAPSHYPATAGVMAAMTYLSQYAAAMTVAPTNISPYLAAYPYVASQGIEQINWNK